MRYFAHFCLHKIDTLHDNRAICYLDRKFSLTIQFVATSKFNLKYEKHENIKI